LAKQREKRYQTAEELQRALHKFLNVYAPDFDPADLAYKAKDLFKEEIVQDRKLIQKLNDKVEQLLSYETMHEGKTSVQARNVAASPVEDSTRAFKPVSKIIYKSVEADRAENRANALAAILRKPKKIPEQKLAKKPSLPISRSSKILVASLAAGFVFYFSGYRPEFRMPTLPSMHMPTFSRAPVPQVAQVPERSTASLNPVPQPRGLIMLKLNLSPAGGNLVVNLNGHSIDPHNPALSVAEDVPLELTVERAGYRSFRREFVIDSTQADSLSEWAVDVALEPLNFGYLTIHTTPSADVSLVIDGTPWVKHTPIEKEKLPVGIYLVKMKNEIVGLEKDMKIQIKDGGLVNIDTRLEMRN